MVAKTIVGLFTALAIAMHAAEQAGASAQDLELTAGELSGAYIDAGAGSPVVLIVPGSGPTDRDGNNPQGLRPNTYKLLAEGLSERGISSVRVDKRGMFSSVKAGNPNEITVEAYASDYRQWIDTIRATTSSQCVYLLGHSEGAVMVTAAAIGRNDVCGLILVSGAGRTFGDVLRAQLKANPANKPILDQAFNAIEALENGQRVDVSKLHPGLAPLFYSDVQGFLISLMAVDPAALAKKAAKPTLVLQGSTDLQTGLKDVLLLAKAIGEEPVILDGVNHVLKEAPADPAKNFATYRNPKLPLADGVIDAIEAFISREK